MQRNYNQNVTNCSNSWVVCKSKRYNGRVYYFNTLTGVSTWNLSDIEEEKLDSSVKHTNFSDIQIGKYPEPNNSPYEHFKHCSPDNNGDQTGTVTLKHNVNAKKYSATALIKMPLLTNNHCCHCQHSSTQADMSLSPEIYQNFFNSSLNPTHNNNAKFYDKIENNRLKFVQKPLSTLTKCFANPNIMVNDTFNENFAHDENVNKILNNETTDKTGHLNRFNFKNDLRQFLSSKRNNNLILPNDSTVTSCLPRVNERVYRITENTAGNELHEEGLNEPYFTQTNNKPKTKIKKLDLSSLKNLVKKSEKDKCWYIVADVNVLLHHYKFLTILLNSDQDCRLIVLEDVLLRMQQKSKSVNKVSSEKARNSVNFILSFINTGFIILTKTPKLADNSGKAILDSCMKLVEYNYHNIVLLCNDDNLKKYKDVTPVPIFSVNELKEYINSNDIDETVVKRNWKEKTENKSSDQLSNKNVESISNVTNNRKISGGVQENKLMTQKSCNDFEIQTDLTSEVLTRIFTNETVQNISSNKFERQGQINRESRCNGKHLKLNLNRSLSDQSKTFINKDRTEKKNFKWRRKRLSSSIEQNNDVDLRADKITQSTRFPEKPVKISKYSIDLLENQYNNITNNNSNHQIIKVSTSVVGADASKSIESENDNRINSKKSISFKNKPLNESKNVMFEVTSVDMEDNLRTRCGEWVSRFIEIMERVLTEVLQNDASGFHNSLTRPCTLFEAIQYTKTKFCNEYDTVDAACKLADTLQRTSQRNGDINVDMNSKQYMEMYSYGVYLVDSLQGTNSNSKDIQTASKALAELLSDIQNPIQHTIKEESFVDEANGTLVNDGNTMNKEFEENSFTSNQERLRALSSNKSETKCKLISQINKNNTEKELTDHVIRNPGDEISNLNRNEECENETATNIFEARNLTLVPSFPETVTKEIPEELIKIKKSAPNKSCETKFVRNFTQCVDFEDRIKHKKFSKSEDGFDDTYIDDEYPGIDCIFDHSSEDFLESEKNEANNFNKSNNPSNENNKFKNFIRIFLQEIRGTFLLVYCFCAEYEKMFSRDFLNTNSLEDNHEIIIRAREIHTNLNNLCNALNSIYERDEQTTAKKIALFLKCDDFKGLTVDNITYKKYRLIIAKCLDRANLLLKTIKAILCSCAEVSLHT